MVPAIPLADDQIPKELKYHHLLHDLFVVPKWNASLIDKPYADEAFQLGFAFPEKDLFHAMPEALRQGYKLTKVLMHECMNIDNTPIDFFISSYMLKCETFECFAKMPDFAEKMKTCTKRDLIDEDEQPPEDILSYADQILAKLEESLKMHYQESFFLTGCNLLIHPLYIDDFRPLLYMRLCRAMLKSPSENTVPWKRLAHAVAEQLVKDENLQRESFIDEIKILKTMRLDVNWRSENGACLLYFMIKCGLVDGVRMVIEWGKMLDDVEWGEMCDDVDGKGSSAVEVAKNFKQPDIQRLLQVKGE